MKYFFLFIMGISLFVACGKKDEEIKAGNVNIPNVTVQCSTATDCADNSVNGKTGLAFWYKDDKGYALGFTLITCTDGTCTGTINNWITESQEPITELKEGAYNLLVAIDTDDDPETTVGEPFAIDYILHPVNIYYSTKNLNIVNWVDYEE